MTTKLYFAYGSNLNIDQMRRRCRAAMPIATVHLSKHRLVFRGVADVMAADGFEVPGGIWSITEECERALDLYEGVANGLYRKVYFPLEFNGASHRVLFYKMNSTDIEPPMRGYFETIREGYADFGLDEGPLMQAALHSQDEQRPRRAG